MSSGDLTTSQNALPWLGLSQDDGTVARLISAVSVEIQKWLGYQIGSQTYTRTLDGSGSCVLMLPDLPVTGVSSLQVGTQTIQASAAFGQPGYTFDARSVILRGGQIFCKGLQNVQITYTAGYSSVPLDIEQACLLWLQAAHSAQDRDPNVSQIRAGDIEVRYGADIATLGKTFIGLMPPSVLSLLQPYQRVYGA